MTLEPLIVRRIVSTPGQVNYHDIVRGLHDLGLNKDSRVIVHASLSSFGRVTGGAATVAGALTAACATVIAPAFTYQTLVTPQVGPDLNGMEYGVDGENRDLEFWRPDLPAHETIGRIPNMLLRHWDAKRSSHPALSFVAVGRDAETLLATQTLDDPFAPLAWLADHDGDVLLMGVTHRVNTTIHVGERRSGRKGFVRWALTPNCVEEFAWPNDSAGFDALAEAVRPATLQGQIGSALVQRIPVRTIIETTESLIRNDPFALLCDSPSCERCRDARLVIQNNL
jgi:aminoglycoside 3-N-acetyltransferase